MGYKITIQKDVEPNGEQSYPKMETVFEQRFDEVDIKAIARFLNTKDLID